MEVQSFLTWSSLWRIVRAHQPWGNDLKLFAHAHRPDSLSKTGHSNQRKMKWEQGRLDFKIMTIILYRVDISQNSINLIAQSRAWESVDKCVYLTTKPYVVIPGTPFVFPSLAGATTVAKKQINSFTAPRIPPASSEGVKWMWFFYLLASSLAVEAPSTIKQ